jgi:hypothetical protein
LINIIERPTMKSNKFLFNGWVQRQTDKREKQMERQIRKWTNELFTQSLYHTNNWLTKVHKIK